MITTIIIGFLAGVVAKFIFPGKENLGWIMTTVLGVAGSMLASYLGQALGLYVAGQGAGFIGAVVGALILLFAYSLIRGKSAG